jgi:hypothetical protein
MSARLAASFVCWFADKYRDQAREQGIAHAARNLRKQGVPVEYAIAMLTGKGAV